MRLFPVRGRVSKGRNTAHVIVIPLPRRGNVGNYSTLAVDAPIKTLGDPPQDQAALWARPGPALDL